MSEAREMLTKVIRFLPNAGKYMLNVLEGKSNGAEKDRAFGWKSVTELKSAHEKSFVSREWRDLQSEAKPSVPAKL